MASGSVLCIFDARVVRRDEGCGRSGDPDVRGRRVAATDRRGNGGGCRLPSSAVPHAPHTDTPRRSTALYAGGRASGAPFGVLSHGGVDIEVRIGHCFVDSYRIFLWNARMGRIQARGDFRSTSFIVCA